MADPGFPVGGCAPIREGCGPPTWALFIKNVCENERIGSHGGVYPLGGCGPPMQELFTKNVCENERIGSHWGACAGHAPLDPPMQ